jgi:phage tail-like protein
MAATGQRVDPYRNFNFRLEIEKIQQAGFTECTGFGISTDPIEYREGGDNTTQHKLPGQTKYENIVLKWGLTDSMDLYNWYRDVTKGKIDRRSGSIVIYDIDMVTERARWNFSEAWPTKYNPADLNAKNNEIAIETLEIAIEEIVKV